MTRSGRFAAVTNIRGSVRDPRKRSRGELVGQFVRGDAAPRTYIDEVFARADHYSGFHLIAGEIGGEVYEGGGEPPHCINSVHALSNAAAGEQWPKVGVAEDEMRRLARIDDAGALVDESLRFLTSRRGEVFMAGDQYGTRSSTVIVASADSITFVEQTFARGGVPDGAALHYSFAFPTH